MGVVRRRQQILATATAGVVLLGGYLTLDAFDRVPGVLTTADAPHRPVILPGGSSAPVVPPPARLVEPGALPASSGAPVDPTELLKRLLAPLRAKGLGSTTSLTVRDGANGAHLLDVDADGAHTPASVTKLLSAYAVARTMDLKQRLHTRVVDGGGNRVTLVAGGDTALAAGAGDPDAVDGHAGLGDLAAQVAKSLERQGRTSVQVQWDLSYAPGPLQAKHWGQDLVDQGFTTRISMLGLARDRSDPGHAPPLDPARSAATAFVSALKKQGVDATLGSPGAAPAGAGRLGMVSSAPLVDVLGLALRDSDNAMTESLARQGARHAGRSGSTESVTAWVESVLRADGIDLDGVRLVDASGLSDGTTIPVRVLADLLVRGTTGRSPEFRQVLGRLPVAGLNGTLDDRFQHLGGTAGAGYVRAKTGSLPDVSSLAGTVRTKNGRLLVFAVVNNGKQSDGALQTRADLDAIVTGIALCGCS